jgi:ATP-dependent exoDNAse (exonuclease V) beta subunit|tara:strand:+ start:2355 stop:3077 length:723 start_codon:yes stop_codon:yes gene_type:complete
MSEHIKFNEKYHSYTNIFTGERYISATTLINKFHEPFDPEGKILQRCAEKDGVTVQEKKAEWDKISKEACDYGTYVHNVMEDYLNLQPIGEEDEEKYVFTFEEIHVFNRKIITPEKRLWNHEYKVAGTTDVYEDHGKSFNLFDFKTNKEFSFNSKYNKYLLGGLSHLPECKYTTYSLQLSLYAYMEEILSGKKVGELGIFYYDRKSKEWVMWPTVYMKHEVEYMLNALKTNTLPVNKTNE